MSKTVNEHIVVGTLTADPDCNVSKTGTRYATMRVVTEDGKDGNERNFHSVVVFNQNADYAQEFAKKGDPVLVRGYVKIRNFEHEGQKRTSVSTVGRTFKVIFRPGKSAAPKPTQDDQGVDDMPF